MFVLSVTSFLPLRVGGDPSVPVTLVDRGVLRIVQLPEAGDDACAMGCPIRRYRDVLMSFANAGPDILVERTDQAGNMTSDFDSRIHRRSQWGVIPLLTPA